MFGLKYTSISILSLSVFVGLSTAHAKDVVYLNNQDRLSGTITSYTDRQVVIQTAFGVMTIPTETIGGIDSSDLSKQTQIRTALTEPVSHTTPTVTTPPATVPAETQEQEIDNSADSTEPETGLWGAEWSGNVNIGGKIRSGNSDTQQLNIDSTIKAKWEKHRGSVLVEYHKEEEDNDVTVDDRSLEFSHNYFFTDQWFWDNFLGFEQDDISNLDLRTTVSSGLGYQVFDRDDLSLKFTAGPGYQREDFANGDSDSSLIAKFGTDYDQKFYDDAFSLFHKNDLSVPTDDTNAYLFESNTGIRVPLKKGIVASGEVEYDWDNDPAAGATEEDTTYSVKLGYEW